MSTVLGRATWKKRTSLANDPGPDPAHWVMDAITPEQVKAFGNMQPAGSPTGAYLGKLPDKPTLPFAAAQETPSEMPQTESLHGEGPGQREPQPPPEVPQLPAAPAPTSPAHDAIWTPRSHKTLDDFRASGVISHGTVFPPIGAAPLEQADEILRDLAKHQRQHRIDVEATFRESGGGRTGTMHKARFMATVDLIFHKAGLTPGQLLLLADRFGDGLDDPRFGGHIEVRWRDFARTLEAMP